MMGGTNVYKVMLVDDEYMILEGLKFIIPWQELGFEIVDTKRNAKAALAYLKEHPVDLVITDITMPEMSGIELLEQAQKHGLKFAALILSGYQEFDYVKRGIDLGVKNYLVKPVDKQELLESVEQIKKELDETKRWGEQRQLYLETNIIRWLNDELNDKEYENLMTSFSLQLKGPYTVVSLKAPKELLLKVLNYLKNQGQKLLVSSWIAQSSQLLWIFLGERRQLFLLLHEVERILHGQGRPWIGETVSEWENVYESFEKVRQMQSLADFYPDLLPDAGVDTTELQDQEELPFLSFNKALMIGDSDTIAKELEQIFAQLLEKHYAPDYVRYVSFLLFADISRQFPNAVSDMYDETVAKIRSSHTILQLHHLLEDILLKMKAADNTTRYSDTVQQLLRVIDERYAEDLNLKNVAEDMHLSVVYLGQLFKKETQRSFSQYLNQVRIKKAQQLLLYTQKTINEIADETGYNNTNYFSKMFKKLNGITPKEFREQYESGYQSLD